MTFHTFIIQKKKNEMLFIQKNAVLYRLKRLGEETESREACASVAVDHQQQPRH